MKQKPWVLTRWNI